MKIAVLADIHANFEALKTAYNKCVEENVDEFIFLGDYIGDFPYPRKTIDFLNDIKSNYPTTFIRGNKEGYWIKRRKDKSANWTYGKSTTGMLKYDFDSLTDEDIDYYESLPISLKMKYDGFPEFIICHGSPFKDNQSMRYDYPYIDEVLARVDSELLIVGHFHIQSKYERLGKTVINPGAIGVGLNCPKQTQFMILNGHDGKWDYEFYTEEYDAYKELQDMLDEHLNEIAPGWYETIRHLVLTGNTSPASLIDMIIDEYFGGKRLNSLDEIPESIWEEATKRLWKDWDNLWEGLAKDI